MTLTKDDRVEVPLMPHLGTGIVDMVIPHPFNRILVRFRVKDNEGHEQPYLEEFDEHELAPAKPTATRTA